MAIELTIDTLLVQYSSDYVFSGNKELYYTGYDETEALIFKVRLR